MARDDRYGRAANPFAVDGYIAVLAAERGCTQVDTAEEVALDESFSPGARDRAVEQLVYAAEPEPSPLRTPRGALVARPGQAFAFHGIHLEHSN